MKRWVVFEGGSRAGLSARMFFLDHTKKSKEKSEMLIVDSDTSCINAINQQRYNNIIGVLEKDDKIYSKDNVLFPADELTRQRGIDIDIYNIERKWFNDVETTYYNKTAVNKELSLKGIRIPDTFDLNEVHIKPNTLSAGSRGISVMYNVCVQRKLDISSEYVVDAVVDTDGEIQGIVGREVKLRCGYDKLIRFLATNHPVMLYAEKVISSHKMFSGICHLQLCTTTEEHSPIYYIEGSKRISGTSLVNILVGYNPFDLIYGNKMIRKPFDEDWHYYEDLLCKVQKSIDE